MGLIMPNKTKRKNIAEVGELLDNMIDLRLKGFTFDQTKDALSEYKLSFSQHQSLHHKAGEKIREIQENEVLDTRVLHAQRYEILYDWFIENDFDNNAMKMLENVERLIGLHSNKIGLSIHNLVEKTPQKSNIYDYRKLTDDEHNRLRKLIEKAQND